MSKESLIKAIDMAGGQAQLARGIRKYLPGSKIGQVTVWGWLNTVKFEVPPPETVLPIAESLEWKMTPHELRSDLYPNPGDAMPRLVPAPVIEDRRKHDQRAGDRRAPDLFVATESTEGEKAA